MNRRTAMLAFAAAIAAGPFNPLPAIGAQPKVFAGSMPGIAINGYDAVAYFRQNRPVKGSPAYVHSWNGAIWRFADAANRDEFANAPETFAPQYGGYCAYAVANGYTAKTEPEAFTVVDGKLYLNYSTEVRALWGKDIAGNIARGNGNWPGVLK